MSKISGRSFYQLWFNLKHPAFNLPLPLNSPNSWQEQLSTTTWSFITLLFLQWILKLTENFLEQTVYIREGTWKGFLFEKLLLTEMYKIKDKNHRSPPKMQCILIGTKLVWHFLKMCLYA